MPAFLRGDAHAFEGLHALAVAFDHLHVDPHGVARREVGDLAARLLVDLLFSNFCRMFMMHVLSFDFWPALRRPFLIGGPQVGPPRFRRLFGLELAPGLDLLVMPAHQHLGHLAAAPFGGPRVVRVFEQPGFEALLRQRLFRAHDAGQQAHRRVDQRDRRRLAARQHEVAEADFHQAARLDHALVEPFVAAAQDHHAGAGGQLLHQLLVEHAPRGVR